MKTRPKSEKLDKLIRNPKDCKAVKKTLKHISAMAGIREKDIEIELEKNTVEIHAKRGPRNYHARVPRHKKES